MKDARKLDEVTYNEMLELATLGAQVLHNRSVEMAKKYNVKLEVLSSFTGHPGTKVKEVAKRMEKSYISSVAKNVNIARIALIGVPNEIGTSFKVFSCWPRTTLTWTSYYRESAMRRARTSALPLPSLTWRRLPCS